ncbi:MAG TPA: sensor domain-containing diguanylate cyclase [Nitrospiria bacterium]|nr:sensor domain-containing diguanylate cyclase [Candidatus Manganitrophaceae bacterium]HIL35491.1 sensor domain-containing diguanylate cyclase [Candidatus Manganitrophaceae bacterium]
MEPLLVPNIPDCPFCDDPILVKEGVQSLIAIPLLSNAGPIGILYADDFRPRSFEPSIMEALLTLGTQAVISIQNQQAFQEIRDLSTHDSLTGLYNRRYLDRALRTEMDRTSRLQHPLSLIMLDIDHFKTINDKFGHMIGDQVLNGLSRLFESIIRPYDTFARFGGEEFLIVMPETDDGIATALAERLRKSVATTEFSSKGVSMTCSFGVSTSLWDEEPLLDLETFVERADKALYQAKKSGRNQVVSFSSLAEESGKIDAHLGDEP